MEYSIILFYYCTYFVDELEEDIKEHDQDCVYLKVQSFLIYWFVLC